jgi:methionyl-tRNA synthetase
VNYPTWICDPCGRRLGRFYIDGRWVGPAKHVATHHDGQCDVCGKAAAVTEPRDHGHLVSDWERLLKP